MPVAFSGEGWGYISSGTWSLIGQEVTQPVLTETALAANFTNEGGVFGTTRFLKNVMGLWLLQECQRRWAADGTALDYPTLVRLAEDAPPFAALINPDDPRFLAPTDMPATINAYFIEDGQRPLEIPAQFTRCILESLVLRYCQVLEECQNLTRTPIHALHILGGGARNTVVNQWIADALGVPVLAGPVEATDLSNALLQLVALGELRGLSEVPAIARQQPTQTYTPGTSAAPWRDQLFRLTQMRAQHGQW